MISLAFRSVSRAACVVAAVVAGLIADEPQALGAQVATWTIAPNPSVRIGVSDDPDALLAAPVGATRLANGNVVVGDGGDWALREFSPQGKLVRRYGRKGKGPGEISYLYPLMRCGDSLVTNDIGESRLSVFDASGGFSRAFRIKTPIYRVGCNARMQFIVMGWETRPTMTAGLHRPLYPYLLARADSSSPIVLGELPGAARFGPRPYPLGPQPRIAVGPTRAYVALADRFEVRVFDLNGAALPSLTARVPQVEATQADLDAEREREIAMLGETARKRVERDYATMPLAKYLPATRDLIVDADANLWVQHYPRASFPTVSWTIFSIDGKVRATISLPAELEVFEVGRDYVLGRYVDPNEAVPEVRLYRLLPR
jgi:hypothetical protein